jgi:hypothetical protein
MVLLVVTSIAGIFLWTLYQNTLYNYAVRGQNQQELDVRNENVVANGNYSVSGGKVSVIANLTNAGPVTAQIVNLWVFDTSKQTYGFNNSVANKPWANLTWTTLKAGQVLKFTSGNATKVTVPNAVSGDSFNIWFVTARGNTIPLEKTQGQGVIVAQVAQGIGAIAFDFEQFWHYEFSGTPAQGNPLPSRSPKNYTISMSKYTVFHVVVTNFDPLGKDIVLNGNSSIYIICAQKSTVKYGTWGLVNVTANNIYPSSPAQYRLKYKNTIEIYFAGLPTSFTGGVDVNTAYPLNVILLGRKGNNDYGQNIPFVSIYLIS